MTIAKDCFAISGGRGFMGEQEMAGNGRGDWSEDTCPPVGRCEDEGIC